MFKRSQLFESQLGPTPMRPRWRLLSCLCIAMVWLTLHADSNRLVHHAWLQPGGCSSGNAAKAMPRRSVAVLSLLLPSQAAEARQAPSWDQGAQGGDEQLDAKLNPAEKVSCMKDCIADCRAAAGNQGLAYVCEESCAEEICGVDIAVRGELELAAEKAVHEAFNPVLTFFDKKMGPALVGKKKDKVGN
eukprot:TRINITY_DN30179_c0_g1_i1.p1 TRINITY_DN30179_c0_g1~~TRINITY_DN30179_c0_g1_i1.p1  ORF type:complete len:189 (-),score=35.10 TRINITY_DN30179_c0_g1_i1:423-989(-)